MLLNSGMSHNTLKPDLKKHGGNHESEENISFEKMLVEIGQNKNKEYFIRLYEHFAPRVKSFLMTGGTNEETADELAQEAMLTVWQKAKSYNPKQSAASTWIFTIARNKKIDAYRKSSRMEYDDSLPDKADTDQIQADDLSIAHQETEILAKALKDLPDEQAELIKKSFFEDKTHAEIAEETNIPLGTIKSRIRLGLERLRGQTKVKDLW